MKLIYKYKYIKNNIKNRIKYVKINYKNIYNYLTTSNIKYINNKIINLINLFNLINIIKISLHCWLIKDKNLLLIIKRILIIIII